MKQQILATPVAGNAYLDRRLLDLIAEFILNPKNCVADKIDVLRFCEVRVMGCDEPEGGYTETDVIQAIEGMST